MQGTRRGVVAALWVATAAAAFGIGRGLVPAQTPPPSTLPPEELATSILLAVGEGDPLVRLRRTAGLLQDLGPEALPEVSALYERMLPLIDPWELGPFFTAWARFHPAGAVEHALAWPRGEMQRQRELGVRTAVEEWARLDPVTAQGAAVEVAAGHPRLRPHVWRGLVTGWVHASPGPEGLADFLSELRPRHQRDEALEVVAQTLVRKGGADAALAWADPILRDDTYESEFKKPVFESTARAAARWDPERAAAWATEHREAEYAEKGPLIVAHYFGPRDGPAALDWLAGYPAGKVRDQAVREAFGQWSSEDGLGAEAWLDSLSRTVLHDPALEVRAEQLAGRRPEDALGWCLRIQDLARQQSCLESGAQGWYARNAVAAEVWLQQSPLDEEARRRVRRAPRPMSKQEGSRRRPR